MELEDWGQFWSCLRWLLYSRPAQLAENNTDKILVQPEYETQTQIETSNVDNTLFMESDLLLNISAFSQSIERQLF